MTVKISAAVLVTKAQRVIAAIEKEHARQKADMANVRLKRRKWRLWKAILRWPQTHPTEEEVLALLPEMVPMQYVDQLAAMKRFVSAFGDAANQAQEVELTDQDLRYFGY